MQRVLPSFSGKSRENNYDSTGAIAPDERDERIWTVVDHQTVIGNVLL